MVKIRLSTVKWCLLLVLLAVVTIQACLLVLRMYNSVSLTQGRESSADRDKTSIKTSSRTFVQRADNEITSATFISGLPAFSADRSEFVFGALIERTRGNYDLHLTTFLVCHSQLGLAGDSGPVKVHPSVHGVWNEALVRTRATNYLPNGIRSSPPSYYCRMRHSSKSLFYSVPAEFLPNRLSSDPNTNKKLDILRCALREPQQAYERFARSGEALQVEIVREAVVLINFSVPWDTRQAGYMLTTPTAASRRDAWKGYDANTGLLSTKEPDIVHICTGGVMRHMTKEIVPLLMEFVTHHLLLGVEHIHLPVTLGWQSVQMNRLLQVFQSYIEEGRLTISSQSGDGIDLVQSIAGLQWSRVAIKTFQSSFCLFQSKGEAEYLLTIDVDEFFIPKPPHISIPDVIRAMESQEQLVPRAEPLSSLYHNWAGGPGWADGHAHPFCYLSVSSRVFLGRRSSKIAESFQDWIGERFMHGPEPLNSQLHRQRAYVKTIIPTRVIYQGGMNLVGACALDRGWANCKNEDEGKEFCGSPTSSTIRPGSFIRGRTMQASTFEDFHTNHMFYELVTPKDAKTVKPEHAVVHHYLLFRNDIAASETALNETNLYADLYFPNVLRELKRRNLHFILLIPDNQRLSMIVDSSWDKFPGSLKLKELRNAVIYPLAPQLPPLPGNHSIRTSDIFADLPNFAVDYTEYVLSAMIERVAESFDLWLTVFFLCHQLLEPKESFSAASGDRIHPSTQRLWQKLMNNAQKTVYLENGEREQPPKFRCKITHKSSGSDEESYIVEGWFVPNKITPDSNSNRRLDILRCKMDNAPRAYRELARSKESVKVEIFRDKDAIIGFYVPWSSRQAGYLLQPTVSTFDPWRGFDPAVTANQWRMDDIYMCVPGLESPPSQNSLPLYLEFVEHHLQLGVQHFFIAALFSWESKDMKLLQRYLQSYIEEGVLTIVSSSGDDFDGVYSTSGLSWGRDNVKIFHVNMCTYFAKGMANYVGIWDFDEFFMPLGGHESIMDVLRKVDILEPIPYLHSKEAKTTEIINTWTGGRGLADKDGHPLCYMILHSVVTLQPKKEMIFDETHPWLGQRFSHGTEAHRTSSKDGSYLAFEKSIRPTRRIFQGGLHLAGACRLEHPWTGCPAGTEFCWSKNGERGKQFRFTPIEGGAINFHFDHRFDEMLGVEDAKIINPEIEAVINHIQFHRNWFEASPSALNETSIYTSRYFPTVYQALNRRGLTLAIAYPEISPKPFPDADATWTAEIHLRPQNDAKTTPPDVFISEPTSFESVLPAFSTDRSEVALAAMIERVSESWDLFLTTFLIGHEMITRPKDSIVNIRNDTVPDWKLAFSSFRKASYVDTGTGQRETRSPFTPFFCVLKNSEDGKSYRAEAEFIPNKLTPDQNANRRLDIIRCKMEDTARSYQLFGRTDSRERVQVEIVRGDAVLFRFRVPWSTRVNSQLLDYSLSKGTHSRTASLWNPWSGFAVDTLPENWAHEDVHLCTSGLETAPSKKFIPLFLEFVQHHLLIGASHIHLGTAFHKESKQMQLILDTFESYIQDGTVSISSQAVVENTDFIYTFLGSSWERDTMKIFHANMCTYYLKGAVSYVGIWDFDEFFVPRGSHASLVDVIHATLKDDVVPVSARDYGNGYSLPEFRRGGFSNSNSHPYCYLSLQSEVVANNDSPDVTKKWIGDRFSHGPERTDSKLGRQFSFKKSIIPTRTISQVGLHMSGGCKLASPYNGCADRNVDHCYNDTAKNALLLDPFPPSAPDRVHFFDQPVMDEDHRLIRTDTEGAILHFLLFRYNHVAEDVEVLTSKNDYTERFFPATLEALKKRNLDLVVELPKEKQALSVDKRWISFDVVYASRGAELSKIIV